MFILFKNTVHHTFIFILYYVLLRRKGESFEIVGVINLGDLHEDMKVLETGKYILSMN
jgi:hypothetical protein